MILRACLTLFIWLGSIGVLPISAAIATPLAAPKGDGLSATAVVMSYNIRLDTLADGDNAWPNRRNFLTTQIALLRPDILGLQEVLHHQKLDLESALPHHQFLGGGRDDGNMAGEYAPLAIDGRAFHILDFGQFWLSPTPDTPSLGWGANYKRIVVWTHARHRNSGQTFLILNTHWDHESQMARWESGRLMAQWIASHRREGEAVIVLGDFNTSADNAAIQQMTGAGQGTPVLQNAQRVSQTPAIGPRMSFNAFAILPGGGEGIDHIFFTAPLTVTHFATIAQHDGHRVPSDHFPVVAMLAWGAP